MPPTSGLPSLVLRGDRGVIDVRAPDGCPALLAGLARVVGASSDRVGAAKSSPLGVSVLRLGPGQWWIVGPRQAVTAHARDVEGRLHGHYAFTDLSAGIACFQLAGAPAEDILARGTPLDLHPRAFPRGEVRRTIHAKISTVLHRLPGTGEDHFELYVGRSYSTYLSRWLAHAGESFGLVMQESAAPVESRKSPSTPRPAPDMLPLESASPLVWVASLLRS